MAEVEQPILEVFADLDKLAEKLNAIPKSAKGKTAKLLALFEKDKDIFEQPEKFLQALNELSEEVGHAYHTVLTIELEREKIAKPSTATIPTPLQKQPEVTPNLIVQTQPQKGGGMWDYMSARKMATVWKKLLEERQLQDVPQISTSREVIDILDFGRQLIPEFNRVQEYFQQSQDHLYFFNDSETKERFRSELREHLNKIAGIIRTFCKTIAEYRKDLILQHKTEISQGLLAYKMAEYQAFGGMKASEVMKAIRETAGAQDAGGGRK